MFHLVTKPTSKSFEPPPRPANPAPVRSSIPPPKPSNPPPRPAVPQVEDNTNEESINSNAMPDVAQPEVDLLNMLPRDNSSNNTNIPPKATSFDLLGSFGSFETAEAQTSGAIPDLLSESQVKSQGLDDLFGAFAQTNSAPSSNLPDLSAMGLNFNAPKTTTANSNINFDPFATEPSFVGNETLLRPTSTETSPSQTKQPPSMTQTSKDPFADMANLASGLNLNWGAQSNTTKPTSGPSPQTTQFSSPTHQYGGFVPNATQAMPTMARSPMENQSTQQPKPDYSRSHFDTKSKQNGANTANAANAANAAPSAGTGDIFADILGQQGYNFATKPQGAPRSINAMRKEELVKDMDPDKLRIMEWVSNCI